MEAIITYFGQPAKVKCDEKCKKAWGITQRPRQQLSDDPDDYELLSDDELGEAPENPGTYEGGHGKPYQNDYKPNKWCVRECERCAMSKIGQSRLPLETPDFTKRIPNKLP